MASYDAIVIGGGIVGASTAYHLVRSGASTLLIDRRDTGRATDAGAGILAPEINQRDPDPWFDFAIHAVGYYPELVAALAEEKAGETSYAQCGMLLVAATEDEIPDFEGSQQHILSRRDRRGTPSPEDLHPVGAGEARELFPALGDVHGALYFRQGARVNGRQLADALQRAAVQRGLDVLDASVEKLAIDGGRVQGVVADGDTLLAGSTVLAGGAWSAAFGAQLGVEIPVVPQRGQIIHLELAGQPTGGWPVVGAFHGHYIVPWEAGRVAVGATREAGSGFAADTSAVGVREVLDEALRVAPGLGTAKILETRVGLRPMPPDGLPLMGTIPGVENILVGTGHGPTGLQLGPYSGKILAEMALGGAAPAVIEPFRVTRFARPGG